MSERCLVTGGAGFIGSALVAQLRTDGSSVVAVDNLVNGKRENLAGVLGDSVELAVCDIRDRDAMTRLMVGVDVVYHLACLGVRHSIHSPRANHDVNATASLDLLSIAKAAGVGRFVYVSTSEVYGTARWVPMSEDHPTAPMTVYGSSKLAGECYARAFWETYRYPTVVVRPFNTYGPQCHHEGDSGEVIPKFLLRCMEGEPMIVFGDGTQTRDFTFVSDTADGIKRAGRVPSAVGQTINLGFGSEITINDLARLVAEVCGKPDAPVQSIEPRPGDVLRLYADSSRARDILGYEPVVGFKDGLRILRDWYLSSGSSLKSMLDDEIVRNWQPSIEHENAR